MNPNWAEENLQTIRTLMERSALYRRALAPIMLLAGASGMFASAAGIVLYPHSSQEFGALWLGTAVSVMIGAFIIARKQAFKSYEKFWTAPTRRIGQALFPPLVCGMLIGIVAIVQDDLPARALKLPFLWAILYGLALHSAGFFMPRGVRWFGWIYIVVGSMAIGWLELCAPSDEADLIRAANISMGCIFGGLHLAYGTYLYFTEPKNPVA